MIVLINGMKMPKACYYCPFYDGEDNFCRAQNEYLNIKMSDRDRAFDCLLVELPEQQGRLLPDDGSGEMICGSF